MDPFATLGINPVFDVDLARLEKTHRELSRALHPDKFVGTGASERRIALTKAVEVNEAWRIVRDPIRRAEALFARANIPVGETNEPKPSGAFLMDMMEQREALVEAKAARDLDAIKALELEIRTRARDAESALATGFATEEKDEAKKSVALASLVVKLGELRFYRRFLEEVSMAEDDLANASLNGLRHDAP